MGSLSRVEKVIVSYEDFSKNGLAHRKMVKPETVPRSRNLVKLFVDAGKGKTKQGVAGILMYAFQTSWEEDKSP